MPPEAPAAKKIPWVKLAVVALVLAVGAVLVLRGLELRPYLDRGMALIRGASPAGFFAGMALLPAVGVPVLAFLLTAGPIWGERLGMGPVVLLSLAAMTVNFTLTYFLARRALRPLLENVIRRLGYRLPQVEAGDATDLIVIIRVTQGIPYCVQNYLLGLAEVPFGRYVLLTVVLSLPQNAAAVLFGDALLHGRAKTLLVVGGLLVALVAATHLLRRHYARKKTPA
jgi:uncharacterized membrane protein YdjX (TVP38/TMEM64 family)